MSEAAVDLDAYFARVGYDGPRTPTLETLRALHALHPAAIPFEAVDVLLGRGVDLAPAAVDAKLIAGRRGGYCFEHNSLFRRVLAALGFEVEGLIARVRWMAPPGAPLGPRSHMALRVTLEGEPWWVDVGFGGCVLTEPLRLMMDEAQPTAHETFRLSRVDREVFLEADLSGVWTPVYLASPDPAAAADYESANWWTSTHPGSIFRNVLTVARTTPQARFALLNNRLTTRRPDGSTERRELDAEGVEQALAETFGLPVEEAWRPIYARAVAAGADGI
jgi:N-hydroxyarylamine O-acetyltransferase